MIEEDGGGKKLNKQSVNVHKFKASTQYGVITWRHRAQVGPGMKRQN